MVLALAAIPGIANQFILTFFQYTGRDKVAFRVMLIAVGMKLVIILSLGGSLGALAAAVGLAVAQLVQCLLFGILLWIEGKPRISNAATKPAREKVK